MLPISVLMTEHRLIERMIKLMGIELERILKENKADVDFIRTAVDFIRTYTDKCHHGKEEHILFRDAAKKPLPEDLRKTLDELLSEHATGRNATTELASAGQKYSDGDKTAINNITKYMKTLFEFYPKHIEKEDKHFFLQSMDYFSKQEQADMFEQFREYDRSIIHEIYRNIVEKIESR